MIELILLGCTVGFLSGFFGIGGGTILVPLLLLAGYETKVAIGISVVQMVFSSIYGSYLNKKKGTLDVGMIVTIGAGGFVGALLSGEIVAHLSSYTLEVIFFFFALFALVRLFVKTHEHAQQREVNKFILFAIGLVLGAMSMSIGVGGSIVIVPLLAGFFYVPLKKAISAGLFFVVFSSVSGLISHALSEHIDFKSGLIIGISSLFGVYIGIYFKDKIEVGLQRKLLVVFYIFVVGYLGKRVFL